MKYVLIILLMLVIFTISVTLGAHNNHLVTFNYLLAQSQYRMSTLITVLFGSGFIIGWAICGMFWLRTRVALMRAEHKIKRLGQCLYSVGEKTPSVPANTSGDASKE